MVEVLISDVLLETVGVVATVTIGVVAVGEVTETEGEVAALAKAADRAFCSAVIPSGRRGIAGGLSRERFIAGERAEGRGELSFVEVVESAGDFDDATSRVCESVGGGGGRTFEKRDRPRPGVSGIDAILEWYNAMCRGIDTRRINEGIYQAVIAEKGQ